MIEFLAPFNIAGDGFLARFTNARWYPVPGYGNYTAVATTNNRLYAMPFWIGRQATLDGVACEVTTLGTGNLRAGLYRDDGNAMPGALVADYGVLSAASTGIKTAWAVTPNNLLVAELYWLGIASQTSAAPQMRCLQGVHPLVAEDGATPGMGTGNKMAYYKTNVTGALPDPFGTPDGFTQAIHCRVRFG